MKATFRLPDALADELRRRSEEEGRSINATTVDALWRGLGHEPETDEVTRIFGSWIVKPATARYNPEVVERKLKDLDGAAHGLDEALDWSRGDR